jgi:hypothetical protein
MRTDAADSGLNRHSPESGRKYCRVPQRPQLELRALLVLQHTQLDLSNHNSSFALALERADAIRGAVTRWPVEAGGGVAYICTTKTVRATNYVE